MDIDSLNQVTFSAFRDELQKIASSGVLSEDLSKIALQLGSMRDSIGYVPGLMPVQSQLAPAIAARRAAEAAKAAKPGLMARFAGGVKNLISGARMPVLQKAAGADLLEILSKLAAGINYEALARAADAAKAVPRGMSGAVPGVISGASRLTGSGLPAATHIGPARVSSLLRKPEFKGRVNLPITAHLV